MCEHKWRMPIKKSSELGNYKYQNFGYDDHGLKCLIKMSKVPGESIFSDYCELQQSLIFLQGISIGFQMMKLNAKKMKTTWNVN